jgi:hypothetical protein
LSNGDINQTTNAKQTYQLNVSTNLLGPKGFVSSLLNTAQHADTLELDSSFNLLGNTNQSASQLYRYSDQTGASYNCQLSAIANVLTAFSSGCTQ